MEKKTGYSIVILPIVSCLVLFVHLAVAVYTTRPQYGVRSTGFAAMVLAVWLIAFFIFRNKSKRTINTGILPYFIVAVILSFYTCYIVWGSDYLSLAPYESIDNGLQHKDTLFHSAISESYKRSFLPSILINDEGFTHYHTFSHFLIAIISGLLRMPSFIAYNFLYPIVFIPIYLYAQCYTISIAKQYFSSKAGLNLFDLLCVLLLNTGVAFKGLLEENAVWSSSYIVSESFLIGNTIMLFSLAICFRALFIKDKEKKKYSVIVWVVIPLSIFLTSWAKISVGAIFVACIVFYTLRANYKEIKAWILSGLYGLIYLCCFWLFKGFSISGGSGNGNNGFLQPLSFAYRCSGKLGIWGHVIFISLPFILFLVFELYRKKVNPDKDHDHNQAIWIETGAVCLISGLIPVLLFNIDGGSVVYFSLVIPVIMLILICGRNSIESGQETVDLQKSKLLALCFVFAVVTGYYNIPANNPLDIITGEYVSGLSEHIKAINAIVDGKADDYTIYLESDSYVARVFRDSDRSMFVYPAMTGVGVINASYRGDDGIYYSYLDKETSGYGATSVKRGRLDFSHAVNRARDIGKKYVIHIMNDKYEIVDVNSQAVIDTKTIKEEAQIIKIFYPIQYTNNEHAHRNVESNKIELLSEGTTESPCINLSNGNYRIVFLGNNLRNCEFSVLDTTETYDPKFCVVSREDNKTAYQLSVEEETHKNIYFKIDHLSDNGFAYVGPIMIEKIKNGQTP